MTVRSPSRGAYWKRMAFVVLLCLAAYAIVVSETVGGGTFKVWRPDRMRLVLITLVIAGIAAYELRPRKSADAENEQSGPSGEGAAEVAVGAGGADSGRPQSVAPQGGGAVAEKSADLPAREEAEAQKPVRAEQLLGVVPDIGRAELSEDAEAIWNSARDIMHEFVPDEVEDSEYLRFVRKAARLGHPLAMVKLGDYAFRRGWIVEAYYWTLLAQLHGTEGLGDALEEIRKVWAMEGTPPEYENVTPDFSEMQGVFARAVLRLKCGLEVTLARKRLQELEAEKCPEAILYLAKSSADGARQRGDGLRIS